MRSSFGHPKNTYLIMRHYVVLIGKEPSENRLIHATFAGFNKPALEVSIFDHAMYFTAFIAQTSSFGTQLPTFDQTDEVFTRTSAVGIVQFKKQTAGVFIADSEIKITELLVFAVD